MLKTIPLPLENAVIYYKTSEEVAWLLKQEKPKKRENFSNLTKIASFTTNCKICNIKKLKIILSQKFF